VSWLRNCSNYLSPRLGLFSADSWTLAAIYLRNLFLNWLVLAPLLAALLLVPHVSVAIVKSPVEPRVAQVILVLACVAFVVGVASVPRFLPGRGDARKEAEVVLWNTIPLLLSGSLATVSWKYLLQTPGSDLTYWAIGMGTGLHLLAWCAGFARSVWPVMWIGALSGIGLSGGIGGWLLYRAGTGLFAPQNCPPELFAVLALPAFIGLILTAGYVLIGTAGQWFDDASSEWWARSGAWLMILCAGWLLLSGVSLYGPVLLGAASAWVKASLSASGGVLGLISALAASRAEGRPGKEQPESGWKLQIAEKVLAPVSVLIILSVLATVIKANLDPAYGPGMLLISILCMALLAGILSALFGVNRFSLHYLYRNRLIRAYLGASNQQQRVEKVNQFIGFNPGDNFDLAKLEGQRPLHIVNMALNLTGGKRLAWQTRKAASFTASALGVGSSLPDLGYVQPASYTDGGLTLGTAVAISGAAASSNMGRYSSGVLSFLLTIFNLRLGAWLPSPRISNEKNLAKNSPPSIWAWVKELSGSSDDKCEWINVSDGGHFENLGLYEIVKRRCGLIVVSDASGDPCYRLTDLANAIQKLRVDEGVEIDFIGHPVFQPRINGPSDQFALLRYRFPEAAFEGRILYLKPGIPREGSVSADVQGYASEHPAFPHQTTGDQFFDEDQFEAYRRLGEQTIDNLVKRARIENTGDLSHLFDCLVPQSKPHELGARDAA